MSNIRKEIGSAVLDDSSFSIQTAEKTLPHPLKSVYYIDDDGNEVDIQTGSTTGRTIGILLLIVILVPLTYYSTRWFYRKHQIQRYAHLGLSPTRDDNDTVINIPNCVAGLK